MLEATKIDSSFTCYFFVRISNFLLSRETISQSFSPTIISPLFLHHHDLSNLSFCFVPISIIALSSLISPRNCCLCLRRLPHFRGYCFRFGPVSLLLFMKAGRLRPPALSPLHLFPLAPHNSWGSGKHTEFAVLLLQILTRISELARLSCRLLFAHLLLLKAILLMFCFFPFFRIIFFLNHVLKFSLTFCHS